MATDTSGFDEGLKKFLEEMNSLVSEESSEELYRRFMQRTINLYGRGHQLMAEYIEDSLNLQDCQQKFDHLVGQSMLNGEIVGKNEETRRAEAAALYGELYTQLQNYKRLEHGSRLFLEAWKMEERGQQMILRVIELVTRFAN